MHGILRYLADAADAGGSGGPGWRGGPAQSSGGHDGPEFLLVPVSIVYDQLHEVALMATEARGTVKRPENWAWLLSLAWSQGSRLGRAYVTFGGAHPTAPTDGRASGAGVADSQVVRRVALDASHRINQATPVTVTAVVCLALLGADRALTFDEVLTTVSPFAGYIEARQWSVAGGATLTDRSTIRRALQELVACGVLHCHDTGTEVVWRVGDQQHLIAAFYRNTVIHILVERGIAELSLPDAVEKPGQDAAAPSGRALWLCVICSSSSSSFPLDVGTCRDLHAELAILSPDASPTLSRSRARAMLEGAPMSMANLVLRPFVDAYLVLADRLAACGEAELTVAGEGPADRVVAPGRSSGCCSAASPTPNLCRWKLLRTASPWLDTANCSATRWPGRIRPQWSLRRSRGPGRRRERRCHGRNGHPRDQRRSPRRRRRT
ncbi:MAG: hypothetical protein IPL37_08980 [Austwickia sp.]|nr:hypothetical protein [Austwickia sp.]